MPFKVLALALPLFAMSTACLADDREKNGLPCVGEVCLGDSLADLAKVKWAPAQSAFAINSKVKLSSERKVSEDDARSLKSTYPVLGDAAPYLYDKQFDANALSVLHSVPAACETNEIFGNFGTTSGTPTRVGLSLQPSAADPAKQVWIVTTIVREFPSASSNEEKAEITALLNRRFGKYGAGNPDAQPAKAGEARFFPSGMTRFGFGLSLARGSDEAQRLKLHPACGGMGKTKAG